MDDAPLLCSCFFTLLSKRRRIEHMHGIEGPMVASGHAVCLLLPPWSSDYTGNATKILPLVLLNNRTLSAVGPGLSSRWSLRPDSTQRFCVTILPWCTSICGPPRKPGTRWNICRYSTLTFTVVYPHRFVAACSMCHLIFEFQQSPLSIIIRQMLPYPAYINLRAAQTEGQT